MPFAQRLFLDAVVQAGYYRDAEIYTTGNPDFPDERAGSNDSDKDDLYRKRRLGQLFPAAF